MKISKPAEDFFGLRVILALQARMQPDAWEDLWLSIVTDCRMMKSEYNLQNRIGIALHHLKKVVKTDDLFFSLLDKNASPMLYADKYSEHAADFEKEVFDPHAFPEDKAALYSDAARIAIETGGPIEFTTNSPYAGDIPQRMEKIMENTVLTVIPIYAKHNCGGRENCVLGTVGFVRPSVAQPLTEIQWMYIFCMLFEEFGWPILQAALQYDCKLHFFMIPDDAPIVMGAWQDGVRCISRESLDRAANESGVQTLDDALNWLRGAIASYGFSDPPRMQPAALLHSIERSVSRDKANDVSRSASKTAADISKTASVARWDETAEAILNNMGTIFEQTPAIYFAMTNHGQDVGEKSPDGFHIIHSMATPTPGDDENKALQMLANWVGLTGEPLYLSPEEECNLILQLLRRTTTQKMPVFAIPVYGWPRSTEIGPATTSYTGLHGVFIGFRRSNVKNPNLASWLTWVYTAQHMLAPIHVATQHGRLRYRPVNIDRSQAKAMAPDESLLLPWSSSNDWRKTRPIE